MLGKILDVQIMQINLIKIIVCFVFIDSSVCLFFCKHKATF